MGGGASRKAGGGGPFGEEAKDGAGALVDARGDPAIDKRHSVTGTGRTSFFNHGTRGGATTAPPAAGGGPSPPQARQQQPLQQQQRQQPAATSASPPSQPLLPSPARAHAPAGSPTGGRATATTSPAAATLTGGSGGPQERLAAHVGSATGSPVAPRPQLHDDALVDSIAAMYGEDRAAQELESEMFAHTAMSLGMEQEDLLFNLLYFGGEGAAPDINMAISNARDETVALHSENNTPYKLRPASTTDIEQLKSEALLSLDELVEPDCAVCKDDMEVGVEVVFLPACGHCFHQECLVRWVKLQGHCPVCRASIGMGDADRHGSSSKKTKASSAGRENLRAPTLAMLGDEEDEEEYAGDGPGPGPAPGPALRSAAEGPPGPPLSYRPEFDATSAERKGDGSDVGAPGDGPQAPRAHLDGAAALATSAHDAAVALTAAAVANYSHKMAVVDAATVATADGKEPESFTKDDYKRSAGHSVKTYASSSKEQKYVDDDNDDEDHGDDGSSRARRAESKYDDDDDDAEADENYIPSGAKCVSAKDA